MTMTATTHQIVMQRHTLSQAYVCQFCQLHFRELNLLKEHVAQFHTTSTPITCDYCEQDFQAKLASRVEAYLPPSERGRMKMMFYSPIIFKNNEDLLLHCEIRHNIVNQKSEEGSQQTLQCHRCQMYCTNWVELQAHFEEHPMVNDDGTCGCAVYELFRLSLGQSNVLKLRLKERSLGAVYLDFLSKLPMSDVQMGDVQDLGIKELTKVFCKLMLLKPCKSTEELLNSPLHRLIFDMVFILREICIEEP